jgi:hypothetical protein
MCCQFPLKKEIWQVAVDILVKRHIDVDKLLISLNHDSETTGTVSGRLPSGNLYESENGGTLPP